MTNKTIFTVADNLPPLQSPNTDLVFAFVHDGGGKLSEGANYIDSVEMVNGEPRRTVRWNIDGDHLARFEADKIDKETLAKLYALAIQSADLQSFLSKATGTPARPPVEMSFEAFRRAWTDDKWISDNSAHPVAQLKKRRDRNWELRAWIKGRKPLLEIRKGNRVLFLDNENCPPEKAAKLRAML